MELENAAKYVRCCQDDVLKCENDAKYEKDYQDDVQEHENDDQNCKKDFQEGESVQDGENENLSFRDEKWNIENEQKEYV